MNALWIIAAVSAFYIKGLCGFANTLVFDTVMGFGADNISISPVELVLGYPSNIIMAYRDRKSIKWSFCIPVVALLAAGSLPGMFLLKNLDAGPIKVGCGLVVALAGVEMLLRETKPTSMNPSKYVIVMVGISAGILCGMFGIGVVLGAYLSRISGSMSEFKGNLSFIFAVENTLRIIAYTILGIVTLDSIKQATILLPFMLLGLFGGILSAKFINEAKAKRLVTIMLIISGASLIILNI